MTAQYPGSAFDEAWQQLLRPVDYKNPTPQANYHLVIIGAGPVSYTHLTLPTTPYV